MDNDNYKLHVRLTTNAFILFTFSALGICGNAQGVQWRITQMTSGSNFVMLFRAKYCLEYVTALQNLA